MFRFANKKKKRLLLALLITVHLTGTMIHELGIRPASVPVPHFVPNWLEKVYPNVERNECCKSTSTTQNDNAVWNGSKGGNSRQRKRKSSRRQKDDSMKQDTPTEDILSTESRTTGEKIEQTLATVTRASRRQRKRQRISETQPSDADTRRSSSADAIGHILPNDISAESSLSPTVRENIVAHFKMPSSISSALPKREVPRWVSVHTYQIYMR